MRNRSWILNGLDETAEELAWDHRMDISASVYARMKELGVTKTELAKMLGVDKSQVTRLIKGKRNLTLQTIAEIEHALKFRLDAGFKYYNRSMAVGSVTSTLLIADYSDSSEESQSSSWEAGRDESNPLRLKAIDMRKGIAA